AMHTQVAAICKRICKGPSGPLFNSGTTTKCESKLSMPNPCQSGDRNPDYPPDRYCYGIL
ncbi:hypothetical protein PILCRDRAFT_820519, partial [Piloderma croceum F 1598]